MIRQAFSEDKEFSLHSLVIEYYRMYLAVEEGLEQFWNIKKRLSCNI